MQPDWLSLFLVYLLILFHCNLGYVFLSFDWIKTIIISSSRYSTDSSFYPSSCTFAALAMYLVSIPAIKFLSFRKSSEFSVSFSTFTKIPELTRLLLPVSLCLNRSEHLTLKVTHPWGYRRGYLPSQQTPLDNGSKWWRINRGILTS